MNRKIVLGVGLLVVIAIGYADDDSKPELEKRYPESVTITVDNPLPASRIDAIAEKDVNDIIKRVPQFNPKAFVVLSGGNELASQSIDLDGDTHPDKITFVTDFEGSEKKDVTIRYAVSGKMSREYVKRTQAELSHKVGGEFVGREYQGGTFQNVRFLRVPPEHTDHSWYIRYEGPGWESEKVGYRFYLDWRNAIDIFGKKTSDIVLQNVGLDGFDSYHEMSDWGMDILKVGESLGIGSIGLWLDGKVHRVSTTDSVICRIVANGPVYSQIRTKYFGWQVGGKKYDLVSDLSITAGSRLTRHKLHISETPDNLCTGIVKLPETKLIQKSGTEGEWVYLATYGKQSLAEDNLGMAVLYKNSDLLEIVEDSLSNMVVLKPGHGELVYYFLAAWEKEPDGIKTEKEFIKYLEQVIAELNSPIRVAM